MSRARTQVKEQSGPQPGFQVHVVIAEMTEKVYYIATTVPSGQQKTDYVFYRYKTQIAEFCHKFKRPGDYLQTYVTPV